MARQSRQHRAAKERWHRFQIRQRRGKWVAVFPHPEKTRSREKNGATYEEPVEVIRTLVDEDKRPARDEGEAILIADVLYSQLEKDRIRARERAVLKQDTLVEGEVTRYPILASVDDWLARPNVKQATLETQEWQIAPFREWLKERGLIYLDELSFQDGEAYREHLRTTRLRPSAADPKWKGQAAKDKGWSATTGNNALGAVRQLLNWCKNKVRIPQNPFTIGKLDPFRTKSGEGSAVRWIAPADRQRLYEACRTTQERLLFSLTTELGLRNAEVTHLRWGNILRHVEPPELDVRHTEPDDDDPDGWDPKTGLRVVPIIWPRTRDLIDQLYSKTPWPRGDDDWVVRDPATGERYQTLPKKFYQRLRRETGIPWTYQVGRRIACALAVIHTERLTGRNWTEKEHEQAFGHSGKVAKDYYFDSLLPRRRREEMDFLNGTTTEAAEERLTGLSADLARRLLATLMDHAGVSTLGLSKIHEDLPSDVAMGKWLRGKGKGVPEWFWVAVEQLAKPV